MTAIESLNRLSKSVTEQQGAIDAALDDLPAALKSIDSQRATWSRCSRRSTG